jgi:hypothetical protein
VDAPNPGTSATVSREPVVSKASRKSSPKERYAGRRPRGRAGAAESFAATEALDACPYFQEVLAAFQCPLKSVRLLRLAPGSIIREHSDFELGEQLGEVLLHVPVVTNSQVEFYLAGKSVAMDAGECWYLDLSLPHRVQNQGASERVHLVLDCVLNEWLRDLIRNAQPESAGPSATTGAVAFQQFAQLVFGDSVLRAALRDIQDLDEFLRETVRCAEEHGLRFTTEEIRAAWRAGMSQRARRV